MKNDSINNNNNNNNNNRYAIVTLITGNEYFSGALALGQSLIDSNTKLDLIAMCTPDVSKENRASLSKIWKIRNVEPLLCNHKHNLDDKQYDLKDDKYLKGVNKWSITCTKFRVWQMKDYKRIIFMDSDTLVLGNIDKALFSYSNASFVAAPESFPPDTFNSGFMIITPNDKDFEILTIENKENGSPWGDQGILNRVFHNWFQGNDDNCGKLPYIYNVGAAYYTKYKTMLAMANLPSPLVIHFVSSGKPWLVLKYEYYQGDLKELISPKVFQELGNQAEAHLIWREKFFKQTEQKSSSNQLLLAAASGKPVPNKISDLSLNKEKTMKAKNNKRKNNDQKHSTSSLLKKRKAQKKIKDININNNNNNNNNNNEKTNKIIIPKGKTRVAKKERRTDL
jgi:lipopolysaccharide biosynthesis glycosyltransferase